MFKENKDLASVEFLVDSLKKRETLIVEGDVINFNLYTRDGYQLIDVAEQQFAGAANQQFLTRNNENYIVREDGYVEFPIVGLLYVKGLDRFELADELEKKYSSLYNDPLVLVQVTNRRVFVFMGLDGATVVELRNENMTLLEVLATAGGVSANSKARNIKLIRGDYNNPIIKKIDLSTIDGLRDANIIMQPNDVIIVAPVTRIAPAFLREITPILSLITTTFTLILLFRRT